jgi:hypothetical protein
MDEQLMGRHKQYDVTDEQAFELLWDHLPRGLHFSEWRQLLTVANHGVPLTNGQFNSVKKAARKYALTQGFGITVPRPSDGLSLIHI